MRSRFVVEAIMLAVHGQMIVPTRPVEYVIPYPTIAELYEFRDSEDPIMHDQHEDQHVRDAITDMIHFFEQPFNKKKIERAWQVPWKKSPPLLVNERVTLFIVNALDNEHFGEFFDPIETVLLLTAIKERIPLITDHYEFQEKLISGEIGVRVYDIEDFRCAVEDQMVLYEAD